MNHVPVWSNLVSYSVQLMLMAGVGAALPAMLRIGSPRARLVYYQVLLAACLALPFAQPWTAPLASGAVMVTSTVIDMGPGGTRAGWFAPDWRDVLLFVVTAGAALRILWLFAAARRLRRYRREAQLLNVDPDIAGSIGVEAEVRVLDGLRSPVTFGFVRPVVLLPSSFPLMNRETREAVLCHELLHVRRRDWLFTVAEELIRAALWFHPGVWWLLAEVQLTREQVVDREVLDRIQNREAYVGALLAIAGVKAQLDLAPAPLFLRKHHLTHRVAAIVKEVRMSKSRIMGCLAASFSVLALTAWLGINAFPLQGMPQDDAPGVTVEQGTNNLLHRIAVQYPAQARAKGIEGTVVLEVSIDEKGNVADARVLSGPRELRKAALESVLDWHYSKDAGGTTQVAISFKLPQRGVMGGVVGSGPTGGIVGGVPGGVRVPNTTARKLTRIDLSQLPQNLQETVAAKLPAHVGDEITTDLEQRVLQTLVETDEHLQAAWAIRGDSALLSVRLGKGTPQELSGPAAQRIRVGGNVQQDKLISKVTPLYPPEAKQARIQGVVRMLATIGKDGTVQQLTLESGHPLLAPAAMEAVKQWIYRPTLLNGNPVEVVTVIDVNFTLSQ